MSDKKNDGGPAFPGQQIRESAAQGVLVDATPGMTLRDWFAGQALAGLLCGVPDYGERPNEKAVAKQVYQYADAMLAERARREK